MPKTTWTAKRERPYTHTKDSLLERGKLEPFSQRNRGADG